MDKEIKERIEFWAWVIFIAWAAQAVGLMLWVGRVVNQ
mgnify:CR=1 FL=1